MPRPPAPPPADDAALPPRLAPLLALLLALLTAGFFVYPSGAYPLQSLGLCGGLLLLAWSAMGHTWVRGGAARARLLAAAGSPVSIAAVALALWAAVRWRWSPQPALGRGEVAGLLWMVVAMQAGLAVAALTGAEAPRLLAAFRRCMVLLVIGFALYAGYQYFVIYPRALAGYRDALTAPVADLRTQSMLHVLAERRVAGRLGNPNLFAAQLVALMVFCLAGWRRGEPLGWRLAGGAGLALGLAGLTLTGSRGGVLAGLAALAGGGLLLVTGRRRNAPPMLIGAGLLVLAVPAAQAAAGWIERLGRIDTIRERIFYWAIALKVWLLHPVVGSGPGSFELYYPHFKSDLARESQHAHSWLFQSLAELGLIGALLFAFLFGAVAWQWARRARPGTAAEAVWPLLAVLVLAFDGLYEFVLQWREFLILLGLLAGLGGAGAAAGRGRIRHALNRAMPWAGVLAGLLAIGVTVPLDLARFVQWNARLLSEDGQSAAAALAYHRAARWTPDDFRLWMDEASVWWSAGRPDLAWNRLTVAATLNPRSAAVRGLMARFGEQSGRPEDALDRIDEAIERYPSHPGYRLDRARLLLALGRIEPARAELQEIERRGLPLWEYQEEPARQLRVRAGLPAVPDAKGS